MANVKISALPSTTATTFNDWIIKNDSGETTTSKAQLKDVLGMTSLNGNDAIQSSKWLTTLGTTASTQSAIAIGNGAEATSPYSIAIGHQALNANRDGTRDYYICIGFDAQAVQGATAFGRSARAIGADSVAIGISAIAAGNGAFALGNSSFADNTNSIAIGNSAANTGQNQTTIGSGASCSNGNEGTAIGYSSKVSNQAAVSIGSAQEARGDYSTIIGYRNDTYSGQTNAVAIGADNTISGGTGGVAIGTNNICTHTDAAVLGNSQVSIYTATTHVDNLYVKRNISYNVVNGGQVGGNIDVDCSLGTIFKFEMTANTTPNFINFRDGQQIWFIVLNTTYNVPTATIAGGGDVYAKNSTISPSNNGYTKYMGTFISGDLFLDEEPGFSAV